MTNPTIDDFKTIKDVIDYLKTLGKKDMIQWIEIVTWENTIMKIKKGREGLGVSFFVIIAQIVFANPETIRKFGISINGIANIYFRKSKND